MTSVDRPTSPSRKSREAAESGGRDGQGASGLPENKRLTPLEEMQLVDAHRAGDPDAMVTLLRSYQRRIYSVCYRMLRDPHQAEDVTQDALIRVLEGFESYNGKSKLSTWIIRVSMNCCLSFLRREKLRRHTSLDAPSGMSGDSTVFDALGARLPAEEELSAAQRIEQGEATSLVESALAALDPEMRAILVLRDVQGLEYQQIGVVVDAPVGTVKSRLFRARAALREAVEVEQKHRDQLAKGKQPSQGTTGGREKGVSRRRRRGQDA